MAFPSAPGYSNLPNGNFSPVIYSKKAQIAFRKVSVVKDITNSDYIGEINDYGDTVQIIKEPQLTVQSYVRGQAITTEDLSDDNITLIVDQSNYWAFRVDDLEKRQSHINWLTLATDNAGYKLKDKYDSEVLNYISTQAQTANTIGTTSSPMGLVTTATEGTNVMHPLNMMAKAARILDQANVPSDGRWFVADPIFWEQLSQEQSKLMDAMFMGAGLDGVSEVRNGIMFNKKLRNFKCYNSNNLPLGGTGPSATSGSNYGVILAGHISSTATAEQLAKTESNRDQHSFGDIVRGMHLYGRKVLRPESLVLCYYNLRTS